MKSYDAVQITAAENGYIIRLRYAGQTPQSYGYSEQFVAKTWDEVVEVMRTLRIYRTGNDRPGEPA